MRILLRVHGIVQGVGYRNFVRSIAKQNKICGAVRNVSDGSVEVVAIGDEPSLQKFELEIQISDKYGPQVMNVEKLSQSDPEFAETAYDAFLIKKDKKL